MGDTPTDVENSNDTVPVAGSITRQMIHDRTLELALIDGRNSLQIKQMDYEQAKRDLTGESDFDRQQQILDFPEY